MKTTMRSKTSSSIKSKPATPCVHFEYVDSHAESVCIAGTFNDWHPNATPMTASSPGLWQRDLALAPGTYEYALIVDGHWKPDPRCGEKADNPFGGLNSVLRVSPPSERRGLSAAFTGRG